MTYYYDQQNLRIYQSRYDLDRDRDNAMNPPLPVPSVPLEEKVIYHGETPTGKIYTPPALIQRQINRMRIHLDANDDPEPFSKLIAYVYSTTTNPQPRIVIDKVSNVLNTLYTRIEKLEMDNAVLKLSLEEAQDDLDMEQRRNMRSQYYYF